MAISAMRNGGPFFCYPLAKWRCERSDRQRAATIIVHTRNANAAIPMVQKLRESSRNVEY